jgi:hypothetical protein
MTDLATLTAFFGWCSVVNIGVLLLSSVSLLLLKDTISDLHSKIFGVGRDSLLATYFDYLANYKIMIIVFNIAPWCALKLMV